MQRGSGRIRPSASGSRRSTACCCSCPSALSRFVLSLPKQRQSPLDPGGSREVQDTAVGEWFDEATDRDVERVGILRLHTLAREARRRVERIDVLIDAAVVWLGPYGVFAERIVQP